ncbi:MAG: DUF2239 family protein, partial [Actinomycetota bacterium]
LKQVAAQVKDVVDSGDYAPILIFDDSTSARIELDFRGTPEEVLERLDAPDATSAEAPRGPGRPKLGVVAREVTLLPRHWDWLSRQPGGASVALRKLVETASKANANADREREAREAVYRFISVMAGNEPGFEEASRALFAGDAERFAAMTEAWPLDIRDHVRSLALAAFSSPAD